MYKRVVVPLDGSTLAEGVLPFILQIAGPLDLEVLLVRVVEPNPPSVVEGTRHVMVDDAPARMQETRQYLAPIADNLRGRGVRVTTDVRFGTAVAEIVAAAREAKADLVAMTTRGRSGLGRLIFGSVAEAVLREAEIPVFMWRPAGRETQAAPGP